MKLASVTDHRATPLGLGRVHIGRGGWEAVAVGAALAIALVPRLIGISNDTDISDEGIRGLQLRLMAAGFHPVSEIYASQGPLSLTLFFPLYRLFGGDLVAARLAVVVYSLISLCAVFWIGRQIAGTVAGLGAAAVLIVSPSFVENSRLAFVEVPSLAPALLGLAMLFRYRSGHSRGWLAACAALLAVGALAKPMAATVGLAAGVLLVCPGSNRGSRWRDVALFALVGLATIIAVVLATGPVAVYEQLVGYRLAARAVRGWELSSNWAMIVGELARESPGLLLMAAVGVAAVLRRTPGVAAALVTWIGGSLLLLLWYSPLWPKHVVYLLPPLALLAGAGLAAGMDAIGGLRRGARLTSIGAASLLALLLYLAGLPMVLEHDRRLATRQAGSDAERYSDDLRIVAAAASEDEFIVMDDAYLALLSGRLTPPYLADLSWNRIRARALTAEQAIEHTERFGSRAIVVQDDHLGQLPRYLAYADRKYLLVRSYLQRRPDRFRRVYVHPDADLAAVRLAASRGIQSPLRAEVGPVALLGYTLERTDLKAGSRFGLTFHWEALADSPPEYHFVVRLRDASGRAVQESTWRIGDGAQELPSWRTGQWQVQTVRVMVEDDVPAGPYSLTLGLERPGHGSAPLESAAGLSLRRDSELELAKVSVR